VETKGRGDLNILLSTYKSRPTSGLYAFLQPTILDLPYLHSQSTIMATSALAESATAAEQQTLPTILLVQGSFQIPQVYEKLVKGLKDQGFPTIHPRLPSCSDVDAPDFPQVSLIDDVLAVRSELIRQIEYEEKTVVVVMHSYGGLVGSEAVTEELSYAKRQSQGLVGGVIHLFYYGAFLLDKGQSVLSAFGENPNNDVRVSMSSILVWEINTKRSSAGWTLLHITR